MVAAACTRYSVRDGRLIKIGTNVFGRDRYVTFRIAEVRMLRRYPQGFKTRIYGRASNGSLTVLVCLSLVG